MIAADLGYSSGGERSGVVGKRPESRESSSIGRYGGLTFFDAIFLWALVVWVLVLPCDALGALVVVVL